MAIRDGMQTLVNWVRQLSNAGTAQYTVGTIVYWTDQHLQDVLDRHHTWLIDHRMTWIPQNIGGTINYITALIGYRNLEQATSGTVRWQVRTVEGVAHGTANYSVDYDNGWVTWTSDTGGGTSFMVTAYSYDVYAAAIEVLRHKMAYIDFWYDFRADNQSFSRSQVMDNLKNLIATYRPQQGNNTPAGAAGDIRYTQMVRSDIKVS